MTLKILNWQIISQVGLACRVIVSNSEIPYMVNWFQHPSKAKQAPELAKQMLGLFNEGIGPIGMF